MYITPLIQMHNPVILKHHLNKCMHMAFPDKHFQNSVIVPHQECDQEAGLVTHPKSSSTETTSTAEITSSEKQVKATRAPVACPVKGCFKEYKAPTLKVMVKHIETEHPTKAQKQNVKDALSAMFPSVTGLGLRRPCPDCGTDISVFSNKHQGSAICKKRAVRH